jgi:undecaprenyl-phosphate 4-deoxy-4-formamido-L-arabinose transferase
MSSGRPNSTASVVVPVYNSDTLLPRLVERLKPVLERQFRSYELILVDDDSRTDTWPAIEQLAREHSWIRGWRLLRNYGQHNALLCGIRKARNELIITLDDDLQHPPEEIPKLMEAIEAGADVVYGTPDREQHGFARDLASRITKLALGTVMGAETAAKVSAFRIFRTRLREAFENYNGPHVSIDVLLTWGTTRFAARVVRHDPRPESTSNYTTGRLVAHALNMMTGFSTLPLQISSLLGFAFTLVGVGVLLFVLARFLIYGSVVPGFAFLASIIAIFSGIQLFSLGIIGEYLARVHFRSMDRPPFAVRCSTDPAASDSGDERR